MNTSHLKQTINENASMILRQLRESRRDFVARLLPALQDQSWIPLHDTDCNGNIDETLPLLNEGLHYIKTSALNKFFELVNLANEDLNLVIPIDDLGNDAHVFILSLMNNALKCEDQIICDLSDVVESGVETYYKVLDYITYVTDDLVTHHMYIDDIISSILSSDEINQVNDAVLDLIAKGQDVTSDAVSLLKNQFLSARDSTLDFISQIASTVPQGNVGFMSLISQMYKKIARGSDISTNKNISFTDNSQYIMRDFTGGVISTITSTITSAWNTTKSILGTIGTLLAATTYGVGKFIANTAIKVMDNYTKSTLDFNALDRNYAFGLLQCTLTNSDIGNQDLFNVMYQAASEFGTLKLYVPWGQLFFWIDVDHPDTLYSETKLRTDLSYLSSLPGNIYFPNSRTNLQSRGLVRGLRGGGDVRVSFYHDQGNLQGGINPNYSYAQIEVQGSYALNTRYYEPYTMLNAVDSSITTTNPLSESASWYSELELGKRVYRAYAIMLSFLWELELPQAVNIIISCPVNDNLFNYARDNKPELYRFITLSYSLGLILSQLNEGEIVGSYARMLTNDTIWSEINHGYICNHVGNTYYIWDYNPIGLAAISGLVNSSYALVYQVSPSTIMSAWRNSNQSSIAFVKQDSPSSTTQTKWMVLWSFFFYNSQYRSILRDYYMTTAIPYYDRDIIQPGSTVFLTPPNYTRSDLLAGIFLIAGVVLGITLAISIPTLIIKKRFALQATRRAAEIEGAWSAATQNPTIENVKKYRKLVARNNIQSRLFGGQIFSKHNYWGGSDNVSLISMISDQILSRNDSDTGNEYVSLYKLIHG